MTEIGQGIAKRCRGIPFLITAIGSLLRIKKTKQEWKSFFHEFSMIIETENNALAILQLSYDHLPFALKDCFAYCAIFPKDYEIDVDTLITLWMSQGFIVITESDQDQDNNEQQDLERLGYKYFVDLHGRCFFHEIEQDELGYIKKCRMPNLMHDLAKQIAGKAYATLILKEDSIDDATLVRHVSFDFHLDSSWQISIPSSDLKRIRSLFLPWQYQRAIEGGSSQSICDVIPKFEWLRMLDLHNTGIKKLPDSISELKLLCYLDLSQNGDIKALPKSICGLYFLQTLKLNHCSNLQTLPRGITRLFNLRHLENKSCHCLTQMPRGLSQLSNLRTLSEFGLSKDNPSKPKGKLDELSCLNYLRGEIKIKNLRNPKDDKTAAANMKGKKDVLSLILIWDINSSVNEADCEEALEDLEPHPNLRELSISTYGGSKFSSWLPLLKNLVKLSISRCNRCHCLPRLDQLTNLQVLVVDELMNLEYIMDETSTKTTLFSTLKELRLTNLPKLKGWCKDNSCENATFSCLSRLVVEDCPCLISMPLFPCLEELLVLKNTSWKPFKRTVTTATEEKRALTSQLEVSSSSPSSTLTKSKSRRSPRRTKSLNMKPKSPSFKKVSRPKPVSSTVALDSTLKTPVPAPQNISSTAIVTPLSKLRTLHIIDMPNSDPNMWKSLHSLRSVTLDNVADINDYLKGGLRQVTSLQQLHILRCYNLVEIESWIDDFKTLSKISIKLCPQLRIPHDRIDLITSSNVKVEHCPRVTHIERVLQDQLHMVV
ncbi:putative disease resistance protein RGA4 [Cannabis sativa]|uniref:putative disease resistance protein RGA4 n=1 Tax=Cannabis sativa TaxID=3483 RepID=UPI0029C9D9DD|nr:putative disease resistance protein RGA4 [Cannabis sativa]